GVVAAHAAEGGGVAEREGGDALFEQPVDEGRGRVERLARHVDAVPLDPPEQLVAPRGGDGEVRLDAVLPAEREVVDRDVDLGRGGADGAEELLRRVVERVRLDDEVRHDAAAAGERTSAIGVEDLLWLGGRDGLAVPLPRGVLLDEAPAGRVPLAGGEL